jgi:hypothetical protein
VKRQLISLSLFMRSFRLLKARREFFYHFSAEIIQLPNQQQKPWLHDKKSCRVALTRLFAEGNSSPKLLLIQCRRFSSLLIFADGIANARTNQSKSKYLGKPILSLVSMQISPLFLFQLWRSVFPLWSPEVAVLFPKKHPNTRRTHPLISVGYQRFINLSPSCAASQNLFTSSISPSPHPLGSSEGKLSCSLLRCLIRSDLLLFCCRRLRGNLQFIVSNLLFLFRCPGFRLIQPWGGSKTPDETKEKSPPLLCGKLFEIRPRVDDDVDLNGKLLIAVGGASRWWSAWSSPPQETLKGKFNQLSQHVWPEKQVQIVCHKIFISETISFN